VVLFEAGKLRNPNHPKLHFVLAVLNSKVTADLEQTADKAQPDAGFVDVQGMRQITVGGSGAVIARDSHWQNCFGSIVTASITQFHSLLDSLPQNGLKPF